ncbi:MAG: barstar family protein [Eubacteriales bacterium]|nr:barstar family protein [Eubacteriales bacterium]
MNENNRKIIEVNCALYSSIAQVHEFLKEQLNFPEYYGKNLSALYDVLTESCELRRIVFVLTGVSDEDYYEALKKMIVVLLDASFDNKTLQVNIVKYE